MAEEAISLTGLLSRRCAENAESTALISPGGPTLSYAQLHAAVNKGASQLLQAGIKPGDVVALSFPNTLEVFSYSALGMHACVSRNGP